MLPTLRHRPIHGLLHTLPALALGLDGRPDYSLTHPAVLRDLAEHAEDCMRLAQAGMRGIGALLVHAAPEADVGGVPGEVIESLGHLLAELGELAAEGMVMAAACRAQLAAGDAGA
ncbi:MAG: hypothetical protein EPO01_20410 [Aquabacterium sp.]|jgi:hypothetical protein|nr:MAG: hypothetical protein EPO12_15280 [Aquabacterium sp.]TAL13831.1 MAG: hypothetical protein EPO01_20410 [Aquabacterium sp.]